MALNVPLLAAEGEPVPLAGEYFLLKRRDIGCTVEIAGQSKLSAHGVFYLSTHRIVFVAIPAHKYKFQSFEVSLRELINERFHQPIFGANYLSGVATGTRLANPAKFKLKFNSGGCGTFLRLFFTMMDKYHAANDAQRDRFYSEVQNGKFVRSQQAYFDPSDPSVVYVSQPTFATSAPQAAGAGAPRADGKTSFAPTPAPAAAPAPAYAAARAPSSTSRGDVGAGGGAYATGGGDVPTATVVAEPSYGAPSAGGYGAPTYGGGGARPPQATAPPGVGSGAPRTDGKW